MNDNEVRLTKHFTLAEMTASASHPETRNVPGQEEVGNLTTLCEWLEKLRDDYNRTYNTGRREEPIIVSSGYRCKMLNRAVGGINSSNHLTGCAADLKCKDCTQAIRYAACLIKVFTEEKKRWDEIIIERRAASFWVHFAVRPTNNRCKVFSIDLTT
jgi:hypothetical protein